MIKNTFFLLLFIFGFSSCQNKIDNEVISSEITSSKGESIFICSINFGITGDEQFTLISNTKLASENFKKDTSVKGLDPFIYYFSDDILTLYFRNKINYRIAFIPRTIKIKYLALNNAEYGKLFKKTFESNDFYAVPNNKNNNGFPGMPKPPN